MPKPPFPTPAECPVCGADVPKGARACPHCGADERTGWNDEMTRYDGLDLPDSAYDGNDDKFTTRSQNAPSASKRFLFWLVIAALLSALVFSLVLGS